MTTYYVSTTGSNSGNGSAASPFLTISKAMWNLSAGDEVVVAPGTYNEMVRISASGTANNYITVRSEVPGAAKIVAPSTQPYGVHIQGDYVKLEGFDISGAKQAGVTANLTHHVIISDNIVHDNKANGISGARSECSCSIRPPWSSTGSSTPPIPLGSGRPGTLRSTACSRPSSRACSR